MPVNLDKALQWKADTALSVDMYNAWFLEYAPKTFRDTRLRTTIDVEETLKATENLTNIKPALLREHPEVLPTLRMSTCPPLAVDRLVGLAGVSSRLVEVMEDEHAMPKRMAAARVDADLQKIGHLIERLADPDIFVWLRRPDPPSEKELYRAATIVADRLCGAMSNPLIRNAQEARQLANIKQWLEERDYEHIPTGSRLDFSQMEPGTFAFHLNVPVTQIDDTGVTKTVNIPVDAVVMPQNAAPGTMPVLIEAKSAGDYTNTNKRRKEEATKMQQLRATYGTVSYNLFLCGYFDAGYLGYEAAEGIDWVWEHRMDDLAQLGL